MKKTIKMIGLDLDGTLLNEQKELTAYTRAVLKQAIDQGVIVLVATGRPLSGVPKELIDFPGMRYAMTSNGARVMDRQEDKPIYESLVSIEDARKVLDIFEEYDTLREVFYEGAGYTDASMMGRISEFFATEAMANYIISTRNPVPDVRKKMEAVGGPFDKVQAIFCDMDEWKAAMDRIQTTLNLSASSAVSNNIEVNANGVNKGSGLLRLGNILGIKREEIMACGDGMNDLEMLREVGFGVAMGNAMQPVREVADYVTVTNDEDGVAKAIERFVLM